MANETVIVEPASNADLVSSVDMTEGLIAMAEKRIVKVEKIINLALKVTNERDWVDQQGHPYLLASGAEKIARLFGMGWRDIRNVKKDTQDEKGKINYLYECKGIFYLPHGDSLEAIGTCSSKHKFFCKKNGDWLPLSEIDETNIMKTAYTNMVVNGITRLLGIRNLVWDQIIKSGIDQSKVARVEYKKGFKDQKLNEKQKKLRDELGDMLMAMSNNNKKAAAEALKEVSSFNGKKGFVQGKTSLTELSGNQIEVVYSIIEKQYKQWLALQKQAKEVV